MLYVRKDRIEKHWALMAAPPSMDKNIRKYEEIGTHRAAIHNATLQALEFHEQIGAATKIRPPLLLEESLGPDYWQRFLAAKVLVSLDPAQSGVFRTSFTSIRSNPENLAMRC